MTSPETPNDEVATEERASEEPRRVSPDAPPPDTDLALPNPGQDNPEQLAADGDVHSALGVAPYTSSYVTEPDDLGNASVGRGADGTADALTEQKEQGGP